MGVKATFSGKKVWFEKKTQTVDSGTGTIIRSKEMTQEILQISILFQITFQSIILSKHPNNFVIPLLAKYKLTLRNQTV